jgi:hypothetical protein
MILMKVFMQVPEGAVISAMFRAAVEALLMGTAVCFAQVAVVPPVFDVIAEVVVCQRRHRRRGEQQHSGRCQSLIHDH